VSFGTSPGGTTVGSAQYQVSLDAQAMVAGLAQLEQTTRTSAQQVVTALEGISAEEKVVSTSTTQMAALARTSLVEMREAFVAMGGSVGQAAAEVRGLQGQMAGMASAFGPAGIAIVGATLAVNTLVDKSKEAVSTTVDFAKETLSLQRVMGGSIEQASGFAAVFDRWGVSVSTAERGMVILSKAINGLEDAENGANDKTKGAVDTLRDLGIQTTDSAGNTRKLSEVYLDVIDALKNETDTASKNADAQKLLGRNYLDLLPIIALGSEGFKELAADAAAHGVQLTDKNIPAVQAYIKAQQELEESNKGLNLSMGLLLSGPLTNMSKNLTQTASDLRNLADGFRNATSAVGDFFGEMGRVAQASPGGGEVDIGQLQALDAAAAAQKQADAEKAAANDVASTEEQTNQRRAASATQLAAAKKTQLEQEKKDDQETADQIIRNLNAEQKANEESYQGQLAALNRFKEERTRANEGVHQAALDQLKSEEDATTAAYDAEVHDAEVAKEKRTLLNESTHTAVLAQIEEEKKAAKEASDDRIKNLEEQRGAEFDNIDKLKTEHLAAEKALDDQRAKDRLQANQDLAAANRTEDETNEKTHKATLDRLQVEHDKVIDGLKSQRDGIEATKQAALDAIDVEVQKQTHQHQHVVENIQDEQRAAEAAHTQRAHQLEDEAHTAEEQHQATLKSFQDQAQAAQDVHDQHVRQLRDEQTAEENASQATQAALKAQGDEESRQHSQRLADIAAESKASQAALQQQLDALNKGQQTDTFAAQQAKLQQAVAQAQTGVQIATEIAHNTGDPNTVIAARKALAEAQAALDKANADRSVQIQKDAINQQISALKDQTDSKKQAEDDQYQAEKDRITKEISDEQAHLKAVKDAISQQVQAADDELAAIKRVVQQETDAENLAYQRRIDQINSEKRANDDRLAAAVANVQKEQRAEDDGFKAFEVRETNKRHDAETTATGAINDIQKQTDAENKAYAGAQKTENDRYSDEQQKIKDTRAIAAATLAATRLQEDQDATHRKEQIEADAKNQHKQIDDLYNAPKTGLIEIEKNAEHESELDFDARKLKSDETYKAEQDQIALTYDNKDTGLFQKLKDAYDTQKTQYDLRKLDIDATYKKEKDNIYDTFDKDTGDPATSGLIPNLKSAYETTKTTLADQVLRWQDWKRDVGIEIDDAIKKVGDLISKVKELNNLGTTVKTSPGDTNAPDDAESRRLAHTADQGGQRGPHYGGAPVSIAQFDQGPDSIFSRFGISTEKAACGPIAAEALARMYGNTADIGSIIAYAQSHGLWNTSDGMEGGGAFTALAQHFGVNIGDVSEAGAERALASGVPVVVNTRDHYFVAQGYDPASKTFDMGFTGQSVYNQRYMTLADIERHAGPVQDFFMPSGGVPTGGGASVLSGGIQVSVPSLGVNFTVNEPSVGASKAGAVSGPASTNPSPQEIVEYIRQDAIARGMDPQVALTVAQHEGSTSEPARRGTFATGSSWWPFQLHYGGPGYEQFGTVAGMGTAFTAQTGFQPGDPAAWKASVDYALNVASKSGWGQWFGAAAAGISNFQGIPGFAAGGIIPEPTALLRLRDLQPYAVAGEVGPERVAPLNGGGRASREMVESTVHNWYGVTPESVVRDMQNAQRRERLLRGR
jgi:hypothetical protein